jgi:hypothetical protein
MHNAGILALLFTFLLAAPAAPAALKLGSGFTFQGRLGQGEEPARGAFDFELELYDQREGGTLLGTQTVFDAVVEGGRFSLDLDFGRALLALPEAWLEVRVRPAGTGPFTTLEPRQQVAATTTSTCMVDSLAVANTAGVGMTTAPTAAGLEVRGPESDGGSAAAVIVKSGGGIGTNTMFLDGDEIDVLSLSSQLNLNKTAMGDVSIAAGGGDVGVGLTAPEARLHVVGGPDAEPGSGGAVVIGTPSGANLAFDANEIMARNSGAVSTLFLNNDGGDVVVGGRVGVGYQIVASTGCGGPDGAAAWVGCPAGTKVLGGGCMGYPSTLVQSRPGLDSAVADNGWFCMWDHCNYPPFQAIAICARVN